jgi:hypothetical protein
MSLFSIKRVLKLNDEEFKILCLKCNSKLIRNEQSIYKIIKILISHLYRFLFNKIPKQKNNDILILKENLYEEFTAKTSRRFDHIVKHHKDIIASKISQINCTIIDVCYYISRIFIFIILYLTVKKDQRVFLCKIAIDYFIGDIFANYLINLKPKKVIFYGGSYYLLYYFMSIYLSRKNIITSIYLGSPILTNDDFMYINEVNLFHKWQICEIKKYIYADRYLNGKSQHYFLVPKYTEKHKNKKANIAIYSSGMYCRDRLHFDHPDTLNTFKNNEILLKQFVNIYSQKYPELNFKIFLHFGIETIETAKDFYKDILEHDNVKLFEEFGSQKYFNEFEIGLSNISATLFERLDGGHKSCFVFPNREYNIFKTSELSNIVIDNFDNAIEIVERLRKIDRNQYFEKIKYCEVL